MKLSQKLTLTVAFLASLGILPAEARTYYGLMSVKGKELLPCENVEIKREGSNYLVFPNVKPVATTKDAYLIDSKGKRLELKPNVSTEQRRQSSGLNLWDPLHYSEGLAPRLHVEPVYGTEYVDESGRSVIEFLPDTLGYEFHHGLAIVNNRAKNAEAYGAIDKNRKMVIPQIYDLLTRSGDYIFARKGDETFILDDQGKVLLKLPGNCSAVYGPDAKGWFRFASGGTGLGYPSPHHPYTGAKFGFIDVDGNVKIAPGYEKVEPFEDGCAVVAVKADPVQPSSDTNLRYGVIDENDRFIIKPDFKSIDRNGDVLIITKESGNAFDPYRWRKDSVSEREREWKNFVQEYDVIGMSDEQVSELLGPHRRLSPLGPTLGYHFETPRELFPRISTFSLGSTTRCGAGLRMIELLFDETNSKVVAWRRGGMYGFEEWTRENPTRKNCPEDGSGHDR